MTQIETTTNENDVTATLCSRIHHLPARDVLKVMEFVNSLEDREPNKETIAALEEADRISRDPSAKTYSNLDEMFEELRAECTK